MYDEYQNANSLSMLLVRLDPLRLAWLLVTFGVGFLGTWYCAMPNSMPNFIASTFLFGKLSQPTHYRFLKWIAIPKKWFVHFYGFATLINLLHTTIVWRLYVMKLPVPAFTLGILDYLVPSRTASVDSFAVALSMFLLLLHTARRFYECIFISVYSDSFMNVLHYALGFFFYASVTATLLSEAPGFTPVDSRWYTYQLPPFYLRWQHFAGLVLFLFATCVHHQTHVILANLRKDEQGQVVTNLHLVPSGGLFEYVSCPHYFAEILIYISLLIILNFQHFGWWLVLCWVIVSQVISALLTHKWYRTKYKEAYPQRRKAVIPFLL